MYLHFVPTFSPTTHPHPTFLLEFTLSSWLLFFCNPELILGGEEDGGREEENNQKEREREKTEREIERERKHMN